MVKFFINRPIFATVLALIIVVAGLVTLNILPIAQYPEITPPTVQVSAVYPGADAQTVAQTVGLPIEASRTKTAFGCSAYGRVMVTYKPLFNTCFGLSRLARTFRVPVDRSIFGDR